MPYEFQTLSNGCQKCIFKWLYLRRGVCWATPGFEDFENHIVEEPKEKDQGDSKENPPLKELQRKEDQHEDLPKTWKFVKDHPIDQVIGDPVQGVRTRGDLKDTCEYAAYISQLKPKNFNEAENEES